MDQMRNIFNLFLDRDSIIDFVIRDKNGSDIDWSTKSNVAAYFTVKKYRTDTDDNKIFQKSIGSGIAISTLSPFVGVITISKTDVPSSSLDEGVYFYDLTIQCDEFGIIQSDVGTINLLKPVLVG